MAAINIKNLVKKYGDGFPAVNDVSIDIADGEFMILVGPSGCGKSTLLRMIVGLEDITSGDLIDRRPAGQRPGSARPQPGDGVPELRALPPPDRLREHRVPAAAGQEGQRRGRQAGEGGVGDARARRAPRPQAGQPVRRPAAAGRDGPGDRAQADAFLFDEPLSNLDAKLRGQMRTEISRLQKRLGITTVYVTHDQTEAMTLGDRVAVLKRGMLQQLATPRELYDNPGNLFVAGFIGSPPMNFLPCEVTGTTAKLPFGEVELLAEKAEAAEGKGLLIAGIRPENFEDASWSRTRARRPGSTFQAPVDVVEWLGNETYAYIPFEAPPEVEKQLAQLEQDLDGEALRTQLVISLDGASRIKEGEDGRDLGGRRARCTCSTRPPARTSPSTASTPARSRGRDRG